ncbi:MAG: hypothetical protein GX316_04850 [Firmicutes bacterium]|nr:hypothetical protein [Bacillota bacterium]
MSREVSKLALVFVMLALVAVLSTTTYGASHMVFSMEDKVGDDCGAGGITYPDHEVFEPGLFDLENVNIWYDEHNTYYDISFVKVTNPWNAPEGFFHQLIDIYIDAEPGGHIVPAAPGPGVQFSPDAGWEYRLRIQPWGGSRWLDARLDPAQVHSIAASVLPDGKTIRAIVPTEAAPYPERTWQYYVLVGGFDSFGPDQYRVVEKTRSKWSFGGGRRANSPNVIDLLDSGRGKKSQTSQLSIEGLSEEEYPILLPVSQGLSLPFTNVHLAASFAVLVLLGGIFYTIFRWQPSKVDQ